MDSAVADSSPSDRGTTGWCFPRDFSRRRNSAPVGHCRPFSDPAWPLYGLCLQLNIEAGSTLVMVRSDDGGRRMHFGFLMEICFVV